MEKSNSMKHSASGRKICEPSILKWPKISETNDQDIREIIERIFQKYKKYMRSQCKDGSTGVVLDPLSDKEMKERKTFRSTFVIGFNAIIRQLETDQLRLVLMNQSTSPAVLKKTVLSMTSQQRCPAIPVSDLLSPLSKSWTAVKSATCFGIVKSDGKNDFDELVNYVQGLKLPIPKSDLPSIDKKKVFDDLKGLKTDSVDKGTSDEQKKPTKPLRPVVDFTKYYKPVNEKEQVKKFSGQSFIGFTDEVCDEIVVFKNGTKVTEEISKDMECYGIKPFLNEISSEKTIKGVKRKHDLEMSKSDYKSFNIHQLQPNVNKKRRIKKKGKTNLC